MTRHEDEIRRGFVKEWLRKAEEDIGVAEHLAAENVGYYAAIGFHAQQAAEKYLKAFLVDRQLEFPKTHDLAELLDLVAGADSSLSASLNEIVALTPYGVDARYPADLPDISREEADRAVLLARRTREAIVTAVQTGKNR